MISFIFISILKAVITWFIITYLGTNLVGMVGRGFFEKPLVSGNHLVTFTSILATIGICFYIYYWWGVLFLISIILIMISRIPDLYWEVRILPKELGVAYPVPKDLIRKAIKSKSRSMPLWDILLTSLTWIALLLLFFAFFTKR
ncbi:MAG: hypothetical protein A3G49_01265 [Candidatus Sungbacteria bacterium RIFCSPLOWO2_12_FULL_41_11]|uniref:Uncharacterized protein n=1 Tax=Candidatus Sungbacteria bacterium RIFCSPLOWO2_12_FULL_41_11 TaxID=1802286 RepID=A0A1G2LNV9_9BACT|nr:MAG: hypothetical protein A3D41_05450 [Candidatus Sungbacteria bacterium RIFCSPHIGHO2_02_FULL_41_12b]OHA13263.1 MAG: hypothetical protein A3G49_01265 [Candidatus Sungbacteria bacterium RIFCSPLOWO2_12_FULL_41_11]